VCSVRTNEHDEPSQIVCGASNVVSGMEAPCALPGGLLPNGMKIKATKLRGVESAGMLCSEAELALGENSTGIMTLPLEATTGADIREYLDLDDTLFSLGITPNRADCLSLLGVAREVAALTGQAVKYPLITPAGTPGKVTRAIKLLAPQSCALYFGQIISGLNPRAETPAWMRNRLERCGLHSISALVDITNYVMLETGQPLHAFDNARLRGDISVRFANVDEVLPLLNEQEIKLAPDVLLISDDNGPLAMAGVMGGKTSGIGPDTDEIFLESAFFSPEAIIGRARRYGFTSNASHRFERGVDFANAESALQYACQLVLEICGGVASPACCAKAAEHLPSRSPVRLNAQRASRLLGIALDTAQMTEILHRIELEVDVDDEPDTLLVTPPSWRFDLAIEADLIEEVARLYGYENIPPSGQHSVLGTLRMSTQSERARTLPALRSRLVDLGYQEVVNLAFVDPEWEADLSKVEPRLGVQLANPLSVRLSSMRSTLLGGLVANLQTNLRRKQESVRLFESGRCFWRHKESSDSVETPEDFAQPWKLGLLAWGHYEPEQWGGTTRPFDFFDLKGDVETILDNTSIAADLAWQKYGHPALHPGRSAALVREGQAVGVLGELHPRWVQKYDLVFPPVLAELELEAMLPTPVPRHEAISPLPALTRDLAVIVDAQCPAGEVLAVLQSQQSEVIKEIKLFDLYAGSGVAPGKKSLAFRVVMQDTERTLRDEEADQTVGALLVLLSERYAATLRT